MAKVILFCADGTWNGSQDPESTKLVDDHKEAATEGQHGTNVLKLFGNLAGTITDETRDLANEREKVARDGGRDRQWAKYMHGVGDSRNVAIRVAGGTLGVGVIARIVRGFTFISRVYEPGDAIHIVGFSRGAYTARALAGMIAKIGLLDPTKYDVTDKEHAYELGVAAWAQAKTTTFDLGRLTGIATRIADWVQGKAATQLPKDALIANVPIKSVAVWDTVGAMGIPHYDGETRLDVFRFTDDSLSPKVERGFHAMAIDEMRRDFPVTRWKARDGVEQVWFVGAHSDVGGGAGRDGTLLSDVALGWMARKLAGVGVQFAAPLSYRGAPDVLRGVCTEMWKRPPFNLFKPDARTVLAGDVLHRSVLERWNAEVDEPYRPDALEAFRKTGLAAFQFDDTV